MASECVNTPFTAPWLRSARAVLLNELLEPRKLFIEPTRPDVAYKLLFSEELHINIRRRIREAYMLVNEMPNRRVEDGYIYVFRDVRNELHVVKIGSTVNVRRRIQEWRTALGATEEELSLLFSAKSSDVRLAEAIMHIILHCQWLPKMERIDTGRPLLEYFRVPNRHALRLLLEAVARHVSWYTEKRRFKYLQ